MAGADCEVGTAPRTEKVPQGVDPDPIGVFPATAIEGRLPMRLNPVLALIALLLSVPLSAEAQSSTPAAATPTPSGGGKRLTPLLDHVLAPPHWFTGTDGRVHLVYELVVTNALPAPITVSAVEVRDADSETRLRA